MHPTGMCYLPKVKAYGKKSLESLGSQYETWTKYPKRTLAELEIYDLHVDNKL